MSRTKTILRNVALGLGAILVVMQFFHSPKNESKTASANDIETLYPVPASVHTILQKACYDCHSNTTRYPWYNNIQPVAWWLNDHVTEGKEELNFSEFGQRTPPRQARKLKKVAHEVEDGGMPLASYTWIHTDARLTEQEKKLITDWADSLSQRIAAQWLADSLRKAGL